MSNRPVLESNAHARTTPTCHSVLNTLLLLCSAHAEQASACEPCSPPAAFSFLLLLPLVLLLVPTPFPPSARLCFFLLLKFREPATCRSLSMRRRKGPKCDISRCRAPRGHRGTGRPVLKIGYAQSGRPCRAEGGKDVSSGKTCEGVTRRA